MIKARGASRRSLVGDGGMPTRYAISYESTRWKRLPMKTRF